MCYKIIIKRIMYVYTHLNEDTALMLIGAYTLILDVDISFYKCIIGVEDNSCDDTNPISGRPC